MTAIEKSQVLEKSFKRLLDSEQGDAFVDAFYERVLNHPEISAPFASTDMAAQKNKLLLALVTIVNNFENPEGLHNALAALGRSHHEKYQVRIRYYPPFKAALLETFAEFLGDDWTDELAALWSNAFDRIAAIMQEYATDDE